MKAPKMIESIRTSRATPIHALWHQHPNRVSAASCAHYTCTMHPRVSARRAGKLPQMRHDAGTGLNHAARRYTLGSHSTPAAGNESRRMQACAITMRADRAERILLPWILRYAFFSTSRRHVAGEHEMCRTPFDGSLRQLLLRTARQMAFCVLCPLCVASGSASNKLSLGTTRKIR